MPPKPNHTATAQRVLDIAEELAQTRGYNGFSYADIAQRMGVTKASLHYHYPSKAELGSALIARYRAAFFRAVEAIDRRIGEPAEQLARYVALYDGVMRNGRMCLCGMLAAEYATLPAPMQKALTMFFDANEKWLAAVLARGRREGSFDFKEPASERARVLLSGLEGAMLVARSYRDTRWFRVTADHILADLHKIQQSATPNAKTRRRSPGASVNCAASGTGKTAPLRETVAQK